MKLWTLNSDLYPVEIYLFPPCSGKEVRAFITKKYKMDSSVYCRYDGCCFSLIHTITNHKIFFVWLSRFDPREALSIANLAHELSHLVHTVFRYLNIPEGIEDNNEAAAYFLSFLMKQCMLLLGRKRIK